MTEGSPPFLVLVVDDEPMIRMFAVDVLTDEGFTVLEAGDAEEATSILDGNHAIGALFTDINMPGAVNGLGLAAAVRRSRPAVKVIITSGRIRPSEDQLPEGTVFVAKPYRPSEIVTLLRASRTTA